MPNIIKFPKPDLTKQVTQDGKTVTLQVSEIANGDWILEIVNQYRGVTTWKKCFPSSQAAIDEALATIEEDGIDIFIGEDPDMIASISNDNFKTVNRIAIVIRYKKAFVDWVNATDPEHPFSMESANSEPHVYLVDEIDGDTGPESYILVRAVHDEIFESELTAWYRDKRCWPQNRGWQLFQTFFEYSVLSLVFDLGATPLKHDE